MLCRSLQSIEISRTTISPDTRVPTGYFGIAVGIVAT